jgi:hypothetical protein
MRIRYPDNLHPERTYSIDVIMSHFLGLKYVHWPEDRKDIVIEDDSGKKLFLPDWFFRNYSLKPQENKKQPERNTYWLEIPQHHVLRDTLGESKIPVLFCDSNYKKNKSIFSIEEDQLHLRIDVFGSAFYMLTRYEEIENLTRDEHDRFPAYASHAYQNGYLHRPVVDEYVEILWWCMKRLWPRLERKPRKFRMLLSHDVDVPFAEAFSSPKRILRSLGGDMIKRKDPKRALSRLESWVATRREEFRKDSNYTFDRIMDLSEKHALKSAFYFKTACTNPLFDDGYSIDHPYLRQLLRDIHARGHEIGFHPSYETYTDPQQTKKEFRKLLRVCEEERIEQANWGGRQHYLRWQAPITWRNWAEAGLAYDSTLSYADCAGFRCATCHEFPVFDLEQGKQLPLIERPLIAMEGSLFGKKYMGLNHAEAYDQMKMLKDQCRRYQGDFTLLWHNSSFASRKDWELYRQILSS